MMSKAHQLYLETLMQQIDTQGKLPYNSLCLLWKHIYCSKFVDVRQHRNRIIFVLAINWPPLALHAYRNFQPLVHKLVHRP